MAKLSACALLPIVTIVVILFLRTTPPFETVGGEFHTLKSEKWTLVNYFAEWCKPCLEEIPELNALAENESVRVFGVSYDKLSETDIISIVERHHIQFPLIKTASLESFPLSLPSVLPTTYVLSPKGEVVHVIRGKVTEGEIDALLEQYAINH